MNETTYRAPTDSEIRAMPSHERKAVYQQHKIARIGGQYRRIGGEWHVAVALEFLRDEPKVGDRIEVEVRKQGQLRNETQTIDIYRIADDERFALPTAYGRIAKPDLPEGVAHCIEVVGDSDYGIKDYAHAEDEMTTSTLFQPSDWDETISMGLMDEGRNGKYRLTDEGFKLYRNL